MTPSPHNHPWYGIVSGPDLQQGDIFESCTIFDPESIHLDNPNERSVCHWQERTVIVLSQSCDLVPGPEKTSHVLLCALWKTSDFPAGNHLASPKGLEEARRGNIPGFHMVGASDAPEFASDVRLVGFRRTWSLPVDYIREKAQKFHLRLFPPYREHLSQAFARYFMRVGLPSDIPAFR